MRVRRSPGRPDKGGSLREALLSYCKRRAGFGVPHAELPQDPVKLLMLGTFAISVI